MDLSYLFFGLAISFELLVFGVQCYGLIKASLAKPSSNNFCPISVVVCAKNESDSIVACIKSLLNQDYYNYEIIVVNDESTDSTVLLLEPYLGEKFRVVSTENYSGFLTGKKRAMYVGCQHATFDWIASIDADCRAGPAWLTTMAPNTHNQIRVGYSPYEFNQSSILSMFIAYQAALDAFHYLSFAALAKPVMAVGRNMIFPKTAMLDWLQTSKHTNSSGIDDQFILDISKKNYQISPVIYKNSYVYSKTLYSWRSYFFQKIRHLKTGLKYPIYAKLLHLFRHLPTLIFIFSAVGLSVSKQNEEKFIKFVVGWIGVLTVTQGLRLYFLNAHRLIAYTPLFMWLQGIYTFIFIPILIRLKDKWQK